MRTACTRPGRIVSDVSAMRPDRRRSPSGASARVKWYSWLKRRQKSVAPAMMIGAAPPPRMAAATERAATAPTIRPVKIAIETKPTSLSRIDADEPAGRNGRQHALVPVLGRSSFLRPPHPARRRGRARAAAPAGARRRVRADRRAGPSRPCCRPCAGAARRRGRCGRGRAARCRSPAPARAGSAAIAAGSGPVSIRRSSSSTRQRVTSHETKPSATRTPTNASSYMEPEERRPVSTDGASTMAIPIVARPARTIGDNGWSRCQTAGSSRSSLTGLRPAPRPARRVDPSAGRPRRGSSPGIRASLAAAAVCSRTVARPNERSIGPAVTSMNCIRP